MQGGNGQDTEGSVWKGTLADWSMYSMDVRYPMHVWMSVIASPAVDALSAMYCASTVRNISIGPDQGGAELQMM